jgi:phospholipid/cholesterol/gamma-HCH transport system substrate-binding protein
VLVRDVAGIVDQTVGDPAFADLFHQMLGRLDKVTRLAQEIVQNNRGNIDVAIKNLRAISVEVHEIVAANRLQIDTIINNGSKLTVEALQITDSVDSIAVSLRSVLATIQRGEGSLGKLVKDETFFHELKRSMAEVDTLVNQINQDGLKLRVKFGFRKPRRAE